MISYKFDWETFNTPKIKTIFYLHQYAANDFGTKIIFKCHAPLKRKKQTLDGELCSNWNLIDSLGVRLDFDVSIYQIDGYKNFYDDPSGEGWDWPGKRL